METTTMLGVIAVPILAIVGYVLHVGRNYQALLDRVKAVEKDNETLHRRVEKRSDMIEKIDHKLDTVVERLTRLETLIETQTKQ